MSKFYSGDPTDNQEVFDFAVQHLANQRAKSDRPFTEKDCEIAKAINTFCMYRGPNGRMCAAGPFIEEHAYSEDFENSSITSMLDSELSIYLKDKGYNLALFSYLQAVHDQNVVENWASELRMVAKKFKLKYNGPEEIIPAA